MIKNKDLEAFNNSEDAKRVNMLMSAAYLLFTEAMNITEELNDILSKRNLSVGIFKHHHRSLNKSFDIYHADFKSMIKRPEEKENFIIDFEQFDKEFRKFAKLYIK